MTETGPFLGIIPSVVSPCQVLLWIAEVYLNQGTRLNAITILTERRSSKAPSIKETQFAINSASIYMRTACFSRLLMDVTGDGSPGMPHIWPVDGSQNVRDLSLNIHRLLEYLRSNHRCMTNAQVASLLTCKGFSQAQKKVRTLRFCADNVDFGRIRTRNLGSWNDNDARWRIDANTESLAALVSCADRSRRLQGFLI